MEIKDKSQVSHLDYQLGEFYYTSPTTAETPYSPLHDCIANEDLLKNAYVGTAKFTAEENVPATPYELFWIPADGVNDAPLAPALVEATVVALVKQDERTAPLTEKLVAKDYVPSKAGRVADIIQVLAKEGLSIASRAKAGGAVKEVVEAPVEKAPIVEAVATKG